ncbi:glycosyltransferase family 2 protein [Candidatus Pacearchaeota archaeon]|nr:glycosyltransferase family 2 protein [Candidatus Pacearchaeota archaeon]
MIDIIITSFNEPKTIGNAIKAFLAQKIDEPFKITISAPDEATLAIARAYKKKYSQIRIFKDPGKGKSYALNQLLPSLKGRIIVLSDGDVFVGKNTLSYLLAPFQNKEVGCVTGRPVSLESKKTLLGYWSHLLCDAGAHEARLKRSLQDKFLECSGYYWAFRNKVISHFPKDVAEDTIVPYLLRDREYKVKYAPEAKVYVKFPQTLSDFIKQKKRTVKSHESLSKYYDLSKLPRTKSFTNELLEGYRAFGYPRSIKEMVYTFLLFPVRLYIWIDAFFQIHIAHKEYQDAWERVESTK